MRVVNLEPYGYSDIAKRMFVESGWEYVPSTWAKAFLNRDPKVDAVIVRLGRKVGRTELEQFPSLRYVLSATTGLDHIDIPLLHERNIQLISLRGEETFLKTIPSTAEHAWGLLLSLMRNIPGAVADVKLGSWNRDAFRGYQLKNRRLGIIGLGRTGHRVASYANAFEMEVGYYDPFVSSENYFRFSKLDDLLTTSDIVSLHVHLCESTENMLNSGNIGLLKKGAMLINTSRGRIWDENFIAKALIAGDIGGVATDVLSTELDNIELSPLWRAMMAGQRVVITPHIGGASWDAMWSCEEFIAKRMLQSLA